MNFDYLLPHTDVPHLLNLRQTQIIVEFLGTCNQKTPLLFSVILTLTYPPFLW